MEGIYPSMREFKDNQEIEVVIKMPLQDREGNPFLYGVNVVFNTDISHEYELL